MKSIVMNLTQKCTLRGKTRRSSGVRNFQLTQDQGRVGQAVGESEEFKLLNFYWETSGRFLVNQSTIGRRNMVVKGYHRETETKSQTDRKVD